MPLALELQAAGRVRDAHAALIAAVEARVRSAPDLVDRLVDVDQAAVEVHGHERLLGSLPVLESSRAEREVVRVPCADAVVGIVRR